MRYGETVMSKHVRYYGGSLRKLEEHEIKLKRKENQFHHAIGGIYR